MAGYWDTSGEYQNLTIEIDPCVGLRCDGGLIPDAPCDSNDDCLGDGGAIPDGVCMGRINYYYGGGLIYSGIVFAGLNVDQLLFYSDNIDAAPDDVHIDIDDVEIIRGDPCPTTCGDGEIEFQFGEDCEVDDDSPCPGKCVPPGETGPNGEPECTCVITHAEPCDAQDVGNGTFQRVAHGGWFTFTADTPAMAIETCGTPSYDSRLSIWNGDCDSLGLLVMNDDCHGDPVNGAGSDPYASCYNGPSALYFPYNACLCVPTNMGEQYWVWDDRINADPVGNLIAITFTKRLDCGAVWENGACCDRFAQCTDDVSEAQCVTNWGTYFAQKLCTSEVVQCPPPLHGACCDLLTGLCNETLPSLCEGHTVFSLGSRCADVTCDEAPGACCDHTPFETFCRITSHAECQGPKLEWFKDTACEEIDCDPNTIPTVSEWGLVILTLLLLITAKLLFARRTFVLPLD